MPDTVKVRATSVFLGSAEGRQFLVGDALEVSEGRAKELEANGLVERVKAPAEPAKPTAPEPKKAPR